MVPIRNPVFQVTDEHGIVGQVQKFGLRGHFLSTLLEGDLMALYFLKQAVPTTA